MVIDLAVKLLARLDLAVMPDLNDALPAQDRKLLLDLGAVGLVGVAVGHENRCRHGQ